jgi:hypothetical protein
VHYTVDIVSRLRDTWTFEQLAIQRVSVGDFEVTVVTPRTLYEMKRDTVRLRDRDDAQRLRYAFDLQDD